VRFRRPFPAPFPADIVYDIALHCRRPDLASLARTHSDYTPLVRPLLYREVIVGARAFSGATVNLLCTSPNTAVRTLRIRPHEEGECPGRLPHLPNLQVLDITISDVLHEPGLQAPPEFCFGWGGRVCPMAEMQRPRTLVVRTKRRLVCDVWAARYEIFRPLMLSGVRKLVAVSDVGYSDFTKARTSSRPSEPC
jgi:hypothetical protein